MNTLLLRLGSKPFTGAIKRSIAAFAMFFCLGASAIDAAAQIPGPYMPPGTLMPLQVFPIRPPPQCVIPPPFWGVDPTELLPDGGNEEIIFTDDDICGDESNISKDDLPFYILGSSIAAALTDYSAYSIDANIYNAAAANYLSATTDEAKAGWGKQLWKVGCKLGLGITGIADVQELQECLSFADDIYTNASRNCKALSDPNARQQCENAALVELFSNVGICMGIGAIDLMDPGVLLGIDIFFSPYDNDLGLLRNIYIEDAYMPKKLPISSLPWCEGHEPEGNGQGNGGSIP